ncbi:uncharacterized protein LOC100181356 [Ciona intestinalis]
MADSDNSQHSSFDEGDEKRDVKYRQCDDMLSRRLAGNMPAALRKKKIETSYKQFITPTGDPMNYVKKHMRSRSMSDLGVDQQKREEQDERNARYYELQKLKEQLKEEEESWSSNLQSWKSRRRSATIDARKRKEDREIIEQESTIKSRRKPKTYKEMLEQKKYRDSSFFDDSDNLVAVIPPNNAISEPSETKSYSTYKKSATPTIPSQSPPTTTYLSKVEAVIKPIQSNPQSTAVNTSPPQQNTYNRFSSVKSFTLPKKNVENKFPAKTDPVYKTTDSFPKTTVVMRNKPPAANNYKKERPKSAYSDLSSLRSSTLPKDYHSYSTPKPFTKSSTSTFSQQRRTAFANKRNMWENIGSQTNQPVATEPKHLATLLRDDGAPTIAPQNEEKVKPTVANTVHVEPTPQPKVQAKVETTTNFQSKDNSVYAPKISVTSSAKNKSSTIEALFDDMKICINQRPRSEKGFGFTVRGGDDGKPVIVNTVTPGGAASVCQLCIGDEILAINDVRLSSTLTQDEIVQLIVDSVITGNLGLDIRRYGKSKKSNPLRLSGTKVVMTSGGFVQVRSDKGKELVVSANPKNNLNEVPMTKPAQEKFENVKIEVSPPPPPPAARPTQYVPPSTSKQNNGVSPRPSASSQLNRTARMPTKFQETPPVEVDGLLNKTKNTNHSNISPAPVVHNGNMDQPSRLKSQLLKESQTLDEQEAKLQEEKRKRIAEAKLEDARLEEELLKIENYKLEQQKRREEEKQKLVEDKPYNLHVSPASYNERGLSHWLIEEAERSRVAQQEGRERFNAFQQTNDHPRGVLPDMVIQRLTKQAQHPRNTNYAHPNLPGTLKDLWNDPSTQATLL